jgi:P-type Mg2+ transporter
MNKSSFYWSVPVQELMQEQQSSLSGISDEEALRRKKAYVTPPPRSQFVKDFLLLLSQFKSPLVLILIFAVALSAALGEHTNTFIILGIIVISGALGFWQERNASQALQKLQAMVQVKATVLRDNVKKDIPTSDVMPGDIIVLNAGDIIPGDAILIEANDLNVNEGALTGESFPVEKERAVLPLETPLSKRKNSLFSGTSVVNGTAKALVISIGRQTEFGKISQELEKHFPETAFETGVKRFGYMIMRITFVLASLILILNIYLGKPVADSILFGLALAVGMAPELLPAIITITLSAGAKRMVEKKVIVKKLASIQNLGSVNVFCSDKTGTLTEGIVTVQLAIDCDGNPWDRVKTFAYLNATFETGFSNPMDEAIRALPGISTTDYKKVDEVPYDFIRKRLSIAVAFQNQHLLITKGALKNILEVCVKAEFPDGTAQPIDQVREQIRKTESKYNKQGFRTIGLCYKDITGDPIINKADETEMIFLGLIVLADSLKPGINETVQELRADGVTLKLITGDNELVATYLASQIGLKVSNLLTGKHLANMTDEVLLRQVNDVEVFVETEPFQKERIVQALRKSGNVVGYIGDGINDASALKAADVGISVDTAVDIAKETADIVLMEKDLKVLHEGIREGRKTFVNTLKYIFITTSANFGNMFSVAGTSLFLPFLPLLPKQILLINLLTDLPAVTIASDNVDEESIAKPRRWDTKLIRNFMIVFGIESSIFDFLTFGTLLWIFQASPSRFQTGWFIESVITEVVILLVIRTQRPFLKSKPSNYLLWAACFIAIITLGLPYLPFSNLLDFSPLPWYMLLTMIGIAVLYSIVAELTKRYFFRRMNF